MRKWTWLVILGVVFTLAIFLRFYKLGQVPVSLYWDEVAMLVDAKSIAATGQDMYGHTFLQAIFPSYGDYKLPVYIWLASISVKLFGVTNWAVRLPSALAGLATILIGGLLAKELLPQTKKQNNQWLMVVTALVLAITPWSIMFSRTGFEGHVGQMLLALSIWLALRNKKQWWWGIGSAVLGGLATYTYFSIRFVWPVVFVAALLLLTKKKSWRWLGLSIILPLIIYAASLWPMYHSPLYAASNQFRLSTTSVLNMADWPVVSNKYKLMAGNSVIDKAIYHPYVLMGRELAKNFADNLSANFLFFTGDPNLRHGTGQHGLFLAIFIIPFIYGWYRLMTKHWSEGALLLIWWLAALLPASVPETTPHALRSLNALVPLAIVISWGVWQGYLALTNKKIAKWWRLVVIGGFSLAVLLSTIDFTTYYFQVYPAKSSADWQDGYATVSREAWENKDQVDVVWVDPFDSRFYLWLMAYEVPVSEYSQIKFENYQPAAIDNIRFRWFDWKKLPTLSEKTLLLAKKDYIDYNLESVPYPPVWYKEFTRSDGVLEFAEIYFERSE